MPGELAACCSWLIPAICSLDGIPLRDVHWSHIALQILDIIFPAVLLMSRKYYSLRWYTDISDLQEHF